MTLKKGVWILKIPPRSPERVFFETKWTSWNRAMTLPTCHLGAGLRLPITFPLQLHPEVTCPKTAARGAGPDTALFGPSTWAVSLTPSRSKPAGSQSSCNVYIIPQSCCCEVLLKTNRFLAIQQVHVHRDPILNFFFNYYYYHYLLRWAVELMSVLWENPPGYNRCVSETLTPFKLWSSVCCHKRVHCTW